MSSQEGSNEPESFRIYALRFTDRARTDIDAAHARFVALAGQVVADAWKDGLFEAVASLSTMPRRALASEQRRFRHEVRQLIYRRPGSDVAYRVLFTIVEEAEDAPFVRIVHVRHGAQRPISRAEAREIEEGR
jgi:plasmid stabilization system protein ParE